MKNYFRLKYPFTSVRTSIGGGHTVVSVWVNYAKAGDLTLRNEEVNGALLALVRQMEAAWLG